MQEIELAAKTSACGDFSLIFSFLRRKLCLKATKLNQTTEYERKIKQMPMEHQFFAPDYSTTVSAAKMWTNSDENSKYFLCLNLLCLWPRQSEKKHWECKHTNCFSICLEQRVLRKFENTLFEFTFFSATALAHFVC